MMEMDAQLSIALEQALTSLTENDIREILAAVDPVSWIESRRMLKGKPFSFKDREYLLQPYRDEYPALFFMKGRQWL